jgi:hypothetical protein
VLDWLRERGIGSRELVEQFNIGWSNRTLGLHLPPTNRHAGAAIRARLQRLGILRPSGHEHFNGCVVVPMVDADGRIVQLYGYRVSSRGSSREIWLDRSRRGLLDPGGCETGRLVVTTHPVDALRLVAAGLRDVTAPASTDAALPDLCAVVLARKIRTIVIASPGDDDDEADRIAVAMADTSVAIRCCALGDLFTDDREKALAGLLADFVQGSPLVGISASLRLRTTWTSPLGGERQAGDHAGQFGATLGSCRRRSRRNTSRPSPLRRARSWNSCCSRDWRAVSLAP